MMRFFLAFKTGHIDLGNLEVLVLETGDLIESLLLLGDLSVLEVS